MKNQKILSYQNKLEKRLFFRYLLLANKPGVYALVNEKEKKVFVQGAKSVVSHICDNAFALAHNLHRCKELRKDRKKLQIKILSYCDNKHKDIEKLKWVHHYQVLGYHIYNTEKLPIYNIEQHITKDFKVLVAIRDRSNKFYEIQKFSSQNEADAFIKLHSLYDLIKLVK